jgi:hypothetical protein
VIVRGAADIISMIDMVLQPAGRGGKPQSGANAAVTTNYVLAGDGITEVRRYGPA